MKNKLIKCPECEQMKPEEQVYDRVCGYSEEIGGVERHEVVCNDCEHEHLMDI